MPKKTNGERQQLGVRVSEDALTSLEHLQEFYAERAGLSEPLSQSDTVDIALRELAKTYKLTGRVIRK